MSFRCVFASCTLACIIRQLDIARAQRGAQYKQRGHSEKILMRSSQSHGVYQKHPGLQ